MSQRRTERPDLAPTLVLPERGPFSLQPNTHARTKPRGDIFLHSDVQLQNGHKHTDKDEADYPGFRASDHQILRYREEQATTLAKNNKQYQVQT
jgi:hypothetical protein